LTQRGRIRSYDLERRRIDLERKAAAKRACARLQNELDWLLRKKGKSAVEAKVSFNPQLPPTIILGLMTIELPGRFHRGIAYWHDFDRQEFCRRIVSTAEMVNALVPSRDT
jgi:hypothetical protein